MARVNRIAMIALGVVAVAAAAFFAGRSTAPTSTSGTTTTTTAAPAPTVGGGCQVAQLRIAQTGTLGAAGTIERTFSLLNASSAGCTLDGYPGLLLLGTGHRAEPTTVVHSGSLSFESIAPSTVTLGPGATAYFNAGYSDVTPPCSTAIAIAVTPPATTASAVVPVSPTIRACGNGTVHVSAIFGSTNAVATQTTAPPSH